MAAVVMSNPLHLAVLGNPLRKRSRKSSKKKGSPMAKRRSRKAAKRPVSYKERAPARRRRTVARRNPMKTGREYVGGLTAAPGKVMKLFKGKNAVKNTAFAAGGLVGTYLIGGLIGRPVGELIGRIPMVGTNIIGQRVLPALIPYTVGFAGSKFIKNPEMKTALMVGGAAASIIELLMPGQVGRLVEMVPGVRNLAYSQPAVATADEGPVQQAQDGIGRSLGQYVSAPSYSGTAGLAEYVSAPSYSGTAGLGQEMLAEYVSAPAYSGTAGLGQEMLAGNYLEDSSMFQPIF